MLFGQILWQTESHFNDFFSVKHQHYQLVWWNSNHNMSWHHGISKLMIESRELCLSCMYVFYSVWHLEHWVSTPWTVNSNILTQKPSTIKDVRIIFKPLIPHQTRDAIHTWMGCYIILNKPTYYRLETTPPF